MKIPWDVMAYCACVVVCVAATIVVAFAVIWRQAWDVEPTLRESVRRDRAVERAEIVRGEP